MTSAGGLVPADEAAELPVSLLLSGPAGGVVAGAAAARRGRVRRCRHVRHGRDVSTDVCLVQGGSPEPAPGRVAAGFPVRLPALDIHTIGAGGGSIASIDPGGALVVGPESAGADPGPACYGRGGRRPTVTDADLVLGRIPADATLGDLGRLDVDAARAALDAAGVSAEGVVAVVDAAMERAVRAVTVERGVDPSELALVAFGGAGPLHACAVAEALGMAAVVVPPRAGVLSAVGLLCSPRPARPGAVVAHARRPLQPRRGRWPPWPTTLSGPSGAEMGPRSPRRRLPLRRSEPRAHGRISRRLLRRAPPAQRLRPAGGAGGGGRHQGPGPPAAATGGRRAASSPGRAPADLWSRGRGRARLHRVDPRRLVGRSGRRRQLGAHPVSPAVVPTETTP